MPHGHCFYWQPSLVWLHVISDALIAAAYFSIPVTLYYFIRRRPDVKLRGIILMFAGFILACGTTHILSVWDIWHSAYRLEGLMKAITAALSVATAIVAIRLGPVVEKISSPEQTEEVNRRLLLEIERRDQAEEKLHRYVEAELLASKDELRSFFEAASQGILGVLSDGSISIVNRHAEKLFGYSRAELIGQKLEILLPERFRSGHVAHRSVYFAEPRLRSMGAGMELAGRRKDGSEFPLEIGLSCVNTSEGPIAYGMVTDISERKQAADELKRVNEELRRSYVEIEQFAHVASHDLQEPLRMVTGYLQLVERRYASMIDDQGREFITYAVDGARRMQALIRDLLEFSRAGTDPANFRTIEAGSLLEDALDNLKTAIDETGAEITSDPLPSITVDPVLLTQVFQNLIANAIKFQKDSAPRVHISAKQEGTNWILSVRDNGIGIEPRHLEKIFQIFERLHGSEEYSGSGIGLAITKKIVERHGGKIWVESQPGAGSTFLFSLSTEPASIKLPKIGLSATP
jgi:PAS domain S-box-containing protein